MSRKIVGILPNYYVHVLDLNTNITTVEVGPQNLVLQDNHSQEAGPWPFVIVPPGHYCTVENPVDKSKPIVDGKLYELRFGHQEVRLHGEPFPLYPGEVLLGCSNPGAYVSAIKKLPVIKANHGIHLKALVDIEDYEGVARKAGDEWQLKGPLTYIPRPEVNVIKLVDPVIIAPGQALRLKARQFLTDKTETDRVTGEEWLVRTVGSYLPGVYEEVVEVVDAYTLTPKDALYLRASCNYTDQFDKTRHIGDEWLVTSDDCESYIPDVTEEVVRVVKLTVLSQLQYCVVVDPLDSDGKPQLGCRQLRKGPATFFLHPGEKLEKGIQNALILEADETLVVTAQEEFDDVLPDGSEVHRAPGDKWMIHGPTDYIPRIEIGNIKQRKAIPLNENEGLYVRNIQSGQVRAILGPQSYILQANEELYQKELPPLVEEILREGGGVGDASIRKVAYFEGAKDPALSKGKSRDKTRVVTYRCPSNCAVQVYNYIEKTARVVFGPDLVTLEPHENFNVLSLSAGKPKKENSLKTICLMLGPDFMTDHITVETSDHARLKVALAMNNHFRFERGNPESEAKLFSVPDFIGFACREIASKIRGMVASIPFEQFHKYSADIITAAVFGKDKEGQVRSELVFQANNLVITNIDIQSIEPVDQHMRDSLSKSVQMAIEISTQSIERAAQHEAKRTEQKARGELDRQKLQNEQEAEESRKELLELQAVAAAVESSGQAKAEAQAQAERLLIEGQSAIELAKLKAEATRIEMEADLNSQTKMQEAEIQFLREQNALEINRAKSLSKIEVDKFSTMVNSMTQEAISHIARSGPESKAHMLQSLGIQSVLITDGKTPINMYGGPSGIYTCQGQ